MMLRVMCLKPILLPKVLVRTLVHRDRARPLLGLAALPARLVVLPVLLAVLPGARRPVHLLGFLLLTRCRILGQLTTRLMESELSLGGAGFTRPRKFSRTSSIPWTLRTSR